jgi:hypothetical protein
MTTSFLPLALLFAVYLPIVVMAQDNPSALKMAQTIINSDSLQLITDGPRKPSFVGPKGSSKLITTWATAAKVEKVVLSKGAVKLLTPASDGTVTLKFSAKVQVLREW